MFARISVTEGSADRDSIVKQLSTQVVPQVKDHPGFRGLTASYDAAQNRLYVLTNWATAADVESSEALANATRQTAVSALNAAVKEVRVWEQINWAFGPTPPANAKLLITHATMDPALLDRNAAVFRDEIQPGITSAPGFCAMRQLVDRKTGESMIGTVWAGQAAVDGALQMMGEGMDRAKSLGITFAEPEVRDVLYAMVPASVG